MYTSKQSIKSLLSRGSKLGLTLLVVVISLTQIFGTQLAFADDGGYPWIGATTLAPLTSDYGYSTCPASDSTCKNYPSMNYVLNGTTYGEADPWIYNLRNCTSYVAWKINQVFGVDIRGWGNATSWDTGAAGHYTVYTGSSHTPQVGEIAQWDAGTGHVAYVYAVNNGIASLDEYNVGLDGLFYSTRTTASTSAGVPDHYIHIADLSPFIIRTGTDIQGKDWLGNRWTTINTTTAADLRVTGNLNTSRISYTGTNGDVWAKDSPAGNMDNTGWSDEYPSPSQYATSPYLFVIRTGTTVSGKAGLGDSWTTLNGTAASDMRVSGDGSITYTATNGDVWAKEWLGGQWYDEYPSPNQYASSDTLFVIRLGTNVYGKQNLGDTWTPLNGTAATDIRVNGNRISYTATNGDVWAKDGLYGTWYDMYPSPSQYAASDNILVVRNGTSVLAKAHLSDTSWTTLNGTSATDIRVNGNRVTYTDTNGDVWAKDYFGGAWTDEYNYPSQYAASNT